MTIPNEIWLKIGQHLDTRELLRMSLCNRNLFDLFWSQTVDSFAHFCPWYRSKVTFGGVYLYFEEPRELSESSISVNPINTPLPDNFQSILGGQQEYAVRFSFMRVFGLGDQVRLTRCRYNDRGLQCGNRLVHLTQSYLPWQKGSQLIIDHEYSLGAVSFELDHAEYTYSDEFISPEAFVIEAQDNENSHVFIYAFKLLTGLNVSSREPDLTVFRERHPQIPTSFLAGTHLFNDLSESEGMLIYINEGVDIKLGRKLEPLKDGLMGVYKGKFYFFSNDKLVRATYLGEKGDETTLACFPDCRYMRQDDRHPRYLCGVGDNHVMQFIADLEDMVVIKMPEEDRERTIYMPGVVEGALECFPFSIEHVTEKLETTRIVDEDDFIDF
ncbi:hypothetical protein CJU89_2427 [Yarrowia sp. B02]|nr:hypothetical protein CJU89_2427 [Yarrowia sp. B02]